jgi:cytochrome c
MFDTMTLTKVVAAMCGTLLVFLFGNWGAQSLYHVGLSGHGDEVQASYVIETGADDSGAAEEEVVLDFPALLAAADIAAGEKEFGKKCTACHKVDGTNATGPHLDGVAERDIGSVDGFAYSGILTEIEGGWTAEALNAFIEKPKAFAPGTKMTYSGMKKIEDRIDIIAYLQSIGG